jgi:hypothetical protein
MPASLCATTADKRLLTSTSRRSPAGDPQPSCSAKTGRAADRGELCQAGISAASSWRGRLLLVVDDALIAAINGAPTLVGGLSSFWPPQLAASKKLASSQAQNDPNANAQSVPRSASRFGASGMVQFSGLWSGLRYSAESRLRYSAESQYSPTPPITADVTVQPFQTAAMK